MALVDIHALWVGNTLNKIAICCLKSFILKGHNVYLHTYEKVNNIPIGVFVKDANLVIPEYKILKHKKTGSYAIFSDIFRYELLRKIDGIYVDCDVYCLKPIHKPESGYLLAFEDDFYINGAVLAMPKNSSVLRDLVNISNNKKFIPPWFGFMEKTILKIKYLFKIISDYTDLPWGIIGPKAITFYINKHDLINYVSPNYVFYPIHYKCINQLFDPNVKIEYISNEKTLCVHLYNEMLKNKNLESLDKNCLMYKFLNNEI